MPYLGVGVCVPLYKGICFWYICAHGGLVPPTNRKFVRSLHIMICFVNKSVIECVILTIMYFEYVF